MVIHIDDHDSSNRQEWADSIGEYLANKYAVPDNEEKGISFDVCTSRVSWRADHSARFNGTIYCIASAVPKLDAHLVPTDTVQTC